VKRIAIVGSREWADWRAVHRVIADLPLDVEIVTGGARGVDRWAECAGRKRGLRVTVIRPDYSSTGRRAPLVRNAEIAAVSQEMIAFWDGVSTGTAHAIWCMERLQKPVTIIGAMEGSTHVG